MHLCGTLNAISSEWWIYKPQHHPVHSNTQTELPICLDALQSCPPRFLNPPTVQLLPYTHFRFPGLLMFLPKMSMSDWRTLSSHLCTSLGDTGSSWYLGLTRMVWNRGKSPGTASVNGGNMRGKCEQHTGGWVDGPGWDTGEQDLATLAAG